MWPRACAQFSHYSATSIIGIIPGTALYVYFGSLAGELLIALWPLLCSSADRCLLLSCAVCAVCAGTIADVSNGDAGPSVTSACRFVCRLRSRRGLVLHDWHLAASRAVLPLHLHAARSPRTPSLILVPCCVAAAQIVIAVVSLRTHLLLACCVDAQRKS